MYGATARRWQVLALGLGLLGPLGCASNGDAPRQVASNEPEYLPPPRPDAQIPIEFELEWEEIEVDRTGQPNPVEVARWVRERNDAVQRCLRQDPMALEQAIELLEEILARVPQSSRDRGLLAQCYFMDARYWWRCADVTAYWIAWIVHRGTIPIDENDERPLDKEEAERLVAEMKPYLERANQQLRVVARKSLKEFQLYRQQRPDDKAVFDFSWKLHFYLQNYEESLRWLEQVIHEMDLAEVPEGNDLRVDYQKIRDGLRDFLAERRIHGTQQDRPRGLIESLQEGGTGSFRYQ